MAADCIRSTLVHIVLVNLTCYFFSPCNNVKWQRSLFTCVYGNVPSSAQWDAALNPRSVEGPDTCSETKRCFHISQCWWKKSLSLIPRTSARSIRPKPTFGILSLLWRPRVLLQTQNWSLAETKNWVFDSFRSKNVSTWLQSTSPGQRRSWWRSCEPQIKYLWFVGSLLPVSVCSLNTNLYLWVEAISSTNTVEIPFTCKVLEMSPDFVHTVFS